MSLRNTLRKNRAVHGRRWTITRDKNGKLIKIKMIFKPEEYVKYKNAKTIYGDKTLLKILDKEFNKK